MKYTSFLNKKLADLLNGRCIVVWCGLEGAAKEGRGKQNSKPMEELECIKSIG